MYFRLFKECPHPDDEQRKELSRELGLEPLQIKFWFQNKRTQMKVYIYLYFHDWIKKLLCDDIFISKIPHMLCFLKAYISKFTKCKDICAIIAHTLFSGKNSTINCTVLKLLTFNYYKGVFANKINTKYWQKKTLI